MFPSDAFRDFEQAGWGDDSVAISYHRHLAEVTRACIPELTRAAGVKAGDKVLDVACGAGYGAVAARDRGADAVGVDFSATQVRLAQQSYPDIRFTEGDAEALPFADAEFDVVLNAFGLPHVPDPDRAAAEAYRVVKPAGRFAYASWCDATKCVAFSMVYDAVRMHGSLDVGLPPGPDFFGCGDPDFAAAMLGRAGFTNVAATEVPLLWRVASPDAIIEGISSGTVRAAAVLNRQSPQDLARIKQYLRQRVASFRQDGAYAVPSPALVVTARKPR
jgi:SAM-dependent methyltransferase